jgi:hypothetical protein
VEAAALEAAAPAAGAGLEAAEALEAAGAGLEVAEALEVAAPVVAGLEAAEALEVAGRRKYSSRTTHIFLR